MSDEDKASALARELGRRGGKKGGPARSKALCSRCKHEIALKASNVRWSKDRPGKYVSYDHLSSIINILGIAARLGTSSAYINKCNELIEELK